MCPANASLPHWCVPGHAAVIRKGRVNSLRSLCELILYCTDLCFMSSHRQSCCSRRGFQWSWAMDQIVRPSFPADGFRGWRTPSQHISHGSTARFTPVLHSDPIGGSYIPSYSWFPGGSLPQTAGHFQVRCHVAGPQSGKAHTAP